MADHDDTYDDKYSRGKVSCPSFNGQARDWKSWLTKMRALRLASRRPLALSVRHLVVKNCWRKKRIRIRISNVPLSLGLIGNPAELAGLISNAIT